MSFRHSPSAACMALGCLVVLFPVVSAAQAAPQSPVAQSTSERTDVDLWYGTLDADARLFRFVLELHSDSEKKWTGTLISLDEGRAKLPLDELILNDNVLSFEIKASAARFESRREGDSKTVDGNWKQGGASLALNFERVDEVPQEKLRALWTGQLNAVVQKLDVAIRELESGEVLFDSISQRAGGFVASKTVNGDEVVFEIPALKAKFTGKQNADGSEIVGTWRQGIVPLSLTLSKSEAKELEVAPVKRPQTPQPPFPYRIEEVEVQNLWRQEVKLSGTLTLPHEVERAPVVVLISGSGPQDRDETIVGHQPFWVIADHLARNGIAVLRFDDRGVGKSTGDHATATSADFASDAESIVKFLQVHDRIDAKRIGVCGHSEGGIIAPMVAAKVPEIAFVILLAGPGVNGEQILSSQSRLILAASGVAEAEIERQGKTQRIIMDLAKEFQDISADELARKARAAIEPFLTEEERNSDQADAAVTQAAAQLTTPWFKFFLAYEPATHLKKLTCPTLVLNGEKDLQVDPKLNLPAIEAALTEAKLKEYKIVEFPKLNHLFQSCKTGNLTEYAEIEETINPKVLETMTIWIQSR